MSWIEDFDLFLFDFDGLLVDTESLHFRAYKEAIAEFGEQLSWDLLTFLGHAHTSSLHLAEVMTSSFPNIFSQLSWSRFYAKKKEIYESFLEKEPICLMEGAADLLNALEEKGKDAVIVTNSFRGQIEKIAKDIPVLKKMSLWITRENYKKAKPDPECYETALKAFPKAKQVIGFEDSLRGAAALSKVHLQPVLVQQNNYPLLKEALESGILHVTSLRKISRALLHRRARL